MAGRVLRLLAEGLSNAEIAQRLVLRRDHGRDARRSMLSKLDLRDRVQAVVLAPESGPVPPGRD